MLAVVKQHMALPPPLAVGLQQRGNRRISASALGSE